MELSIALNRYDRHVPFFNNTVEPPPGITLRAFEIGESMPFRDGTDRHPRILNDLEFDIGEMGFSSFIMAVARNPDLPLVVDRIGRTLSTWLKRSKHRGPLLPDADLLRAAAGAVLSANHTRIVAVPATLVGAESTERRVGPPEMVASLIGSATWTGDFRGLEPLFRAAAWVGMGPGRQNGLGELSVR